MIDAMASDDEAREAASERVRGEWLLRVEAEYRSSVITQHLTLWMTQAGASPDLLHEGLRIAADELDHAELSMEAHLAAGGTSTPRLSRESLDIPRAPGEPLEFAILRMGVDVFCLGETVAVPLFRHLREGCEVEVARTALDRILRDEVRHRDFGWTLLEWMLQTPHEKELRALIDRELPQWFSRIRRSYAPAFAAALTEVAPDDRRWGLMAPAQYASVVDRTYERDWRPRFERLGVDARKAWGEPLTPPR
ncbi:MAG: ferritin-like domain-containing protein [Polyangiales bacterium]